MKNLKLTAFVALITSVLAGTPVFGAMEGPGGTGGGKVVVCHDTQGAVTTVELLDLWEARIVFGRDASISKTPVPTQLTEALTRLKYSVQINTTLTINGLEEPDILLQQLTATAQQFLDGSPTVTRLQGVKLTPTDDSFEPAQPEGNCDIEQIVVYMDSPTSPKILVNQDLLSRMDNTNQAALFAHEALYTYLRNGIDQGLVPTVKETNSIRVRRAIGYVFAGNSFPSLAGLIGNDYIGCLNADSYSAPNASMIYFFRDGEGNPMQVSSEIFGQPMIGFFPVTAQIPSWDMLANAVSGHLCDQAADGEQMVSEEAGSGPVDFQLDSFLSFLCEGHKVTAYLAPTAGNLSNLASGQKMTCSSYAPTAAKQ